MTVIPDDPCEVTHLPDGAPCPNPDTAPFTVGCAHEHVIAIMMCQAHARSAAQADCLQCFWGTEPPHDCRLLVIPPPQPAV